MYFSIAAFSKMTFYFVILALRVDVLINGKRKSLSPSELITMFSFFISVGVSECTLQSTDQVKSY